MEKFCTWFPSPGSVLHDELDEGGSADRELIVKELNLEPTIATRKINRTSHVRPNPGHDSVIIK